MNYKLYVNKLDFAAFRGKSYMKKVLKQQVKGKGQLLVPKEPEKEIDLKSFVTPPKEESDM